MRQADVAEAAGISRSKYSRIERGVLRGIPIGDIEAACRALGADLDVRVRWHGEGLDRLLDAAHAKLVNDVVAMLTAEGWEAAVEVTFSHFGERGSVDVVGWLAVARAFLVIEVKSVVPDAQATVSSHDRKVRLAQVIAQSRHWSPRIVGKLLVVGDSSTSRRRVSKLDDLFRVAYPDRAAEVRRWLRDPDSSLAGLLFIPISQGLSGKERVPGQQRVRRRKSKRISG